MPTTETAQQYIQRIMAHSEGKQPMAVQAATAKRLERSIKGVPTSKLKKRPAPNKWSVSEIVAHLADAEVAIGWRVRLILGAPGTPVAAFDQDAWAVRYAAYQFAPAFALFQAARNWNLLYLNTVSHDDRRRRTTHPERGTMTFWTIVETMAGHDINHLQQIERLTANATK